MGLFLNARLSKMLACLIILNFYQTASSVAHNSWKPISDQQNFLPHLTFKDAFSRATYFLISTDQQSRVPTQQTLDQHLLRVQSFSETHFLRIGISFLLLILGPPKKKAIPRQDAPNSMASPYFMDASFIKIPTLIMRNSKHPQDLKQRAHIAPSSSQWNR